MLNKALLALVPVLFIAGFVDGQPAINQEKDEVVTQKSIDAFACGPCTIINTFKHASKSTKVDLGIIPGETMHDKVLSVIKTYGERKSTTYKGQRFNGSHDGMSCRDTAVIMNEMLEDMKLSSRVHGMFLDRKNNESLRGHLERTYSMMRKSLDQGMPVPMSVRSFTTKFHQDKSRFLWDGLGNHFVTVVEVQPKLRENEKGFSFEYLDSESGVREFGYIYISEARNFNAVKGNSEKWEWVPGREFLCVTAPSLRLKTQDQFFHQRTIITANFGIFPDQLVKQTRNQLFDETVVASCGQCKLDMEGSGCTLAIQYRNKSYFVEGTGIDDHGDAHGEDGFCNAVRHAVVSGEMKNGKFYANRFKLLPLTENTK